MTTSKTNTVRDEAKTWRERWYIIIFEADTPAGKLFDVLLLIAILLSVLVVMLESVESIRCDHADLLVGLEWFFTVIFTLEYVVRLICTKRPWKYVFSFYGIVDLLSLIPSYLGFLPYFQSSGNAQRLTVIRSLRLMRAFRIFKLAHMLSEATALKQAIWASRARVSVFLSFVLITVVIIGSSMHLIEGGRIDDQGNELVSGFDSIPESMYWAVVTMTTVGYGDVSPITPFGKTVAAGMMILGYCLIIVPMGIVSAELAHHGDKKLSTQVCADCMREGHESDALYCKFCGGRL